jgi:hypothetical protein
MTNAICKKTGWYLLTQPAVCCVVMDNLQGLMQVFVTKEVIIIVGGLLYFADGMLTVSIGRKALIFSYVLFFE